jgi:hypothetical protein
MADMLLMQIIATRRMVCLPMMFGAPEPIDGANVGAAPAGQGRLGDEVGGDMLGSVVGMSLGLVCAWREKNSVKN